MAQVELGNYVGFVDKRQAQGDTTQPLTNPTYFHSVATLRSQLGIVDGAYFTADKLNSMTHNDLVYAMRLSAEAAGI